MITNKSQAKAAEVLRAYSLQRKLDNGAAPKYLKRIFDVDDKYLEKCRKLARPQHNGEKLSHAIDHDICYELYRECVGLKEREKGDLFLLDPSFEPKRLGYNIRWTSNDIQDFAYGMVKFISERLNDASNQDSDYYQELLESVKSDFFTACCKICGYNADHFRETLAFKMKQCGKSLN